MADVTEAPSANVDILQERQKARLEAVLFCEHASLTADGKANLHGTFDQIAISVDETVENPGIALFLFVKVAQIFGRLDMRVFDPKGNIVLGGFADIARGEYLDDQVPRGQVLSPMSFPTPLAGIYWFDVSHNGQSLGGSGLTIRFTAPEEK